MWVDYQLYCIINYTALHQSGNVSPSKNTQLSKLKRAELLWSRVALKSPYHVTKWFNGIYHNSIIFERRQKHLVWNTALNIKVS